LQSFAQFGSDLDQDTRTRLAQGQRIVEVLKQKNGAPVDVALQVAIIYAVVNGYLKDVAVSDISAYEQEFFSYLEDSASPILTEIREEGVLNQKEEELLKEAIVRFTARFLEKK
ncbi:MAG: F0F1 ATP synthase subunit alpha, partial [Lachnospiraceae bacterium]|nr:F0F1 ATP synthase subunit alpha [Lachnospiraceae bacterium]